MTPEVNLSDEAMAALRDVHECLLHGDFDVNEAVLAVVGSHAHVDSDVVDGCVITEMGGGTEARWRLVEE